MKTNSNFELKPRHQIDFAKYPAVVFESDDWGACEVSPCLETAERAARIFSRAGGGTRSPSDATLENPQQLQELFSLLGQFHGSDGLAPVFTAFVSVGNPDFAAMRKNGFSAYADIAINDGVSQGWERGDIVAAWRDGMGKGVFAPEFHANLHHTSPHLWLQRLHADGAEGEAARALFDLGIYCQGCHLPEYECMNVREQFQWVKTGVERFIDAVGYRPAAAVTSDAYPITETVWALNGIRTVCLKNSRLNSGEVVVYHTKPWNNQDTYVAIGSYDPMNDVVYLTRNAWFEIGQGTVQNAENVLPVIRKRWSENEPAVISTHRVHYAALSTDKREIAQRELTALLHGLQQLPRIYFLTTAELSDLYRNGWSVRAAGDKIILRKWTADADAVCLDRPITQAESLPDGQVISFGATGTTSPELPEGNYLVD